MMLALDLFSAAAGGWSLGLHADSLDIAALANRLEEEFDIRIGDDEAEACTTVAEAIELIERKVEP